MCHVLYFGLYTSCKGDSHNDDVDILFIFTGCDVYLGLNRRRDTCVKMATMLQLFAVILLLPTFILGDDRPNIVFLLTDDQDVTASSLNYMPFLEKLLRQEGMEFANYFVPTGLCCPSRSTIIRGQYCHNTKIYDNGDLNNNTYLSGAFQKFVEEGLEKSTVGTLLTDAGYETALVGKYLNGYEDSNASHVPAGWNHWMGMTATNYYGPHFSQNGTLYKTNSSVYQTDFINQWVHDFLTEKRDPTKPFFVYIAPFAPHAPATPAHRHANLFPDAKAPRYPSYNPDDIIQRMKPSWIKRLPLLNESQLSDIDTLFRLRLQSLQAVDEMLLDVFITIKDLGLDENTYLFYMGDNGQHLGDFRLPAGKRQAYDTDIRVPFLVRGPGINGSVNVTEVVQSVDLLPTWLELAQAKGPIDPKQLDGKSIVPLLNGSMLSSPKVNQFRSVALAEMYGGSSNMGPGYKGMPDFEQNQFWNNTYQAVRVINGSDWAENANWLYVEWCTGEKELYISEVDPHQMFNIIYFADPQLLSQLSTLVSKLGDCVGEDCYSIDFKSIALEAQKRRKNGQLKCYNPPDLPGVPLRRHPWAYDLPVPEPFVNGFPFADSDQVPEEVMEVWEQYKTYFY